MTTLEVDVLPGVARSRCSGSSSPKSMYSHKVTFWISLIGSEGSPVIAVFGIGGEGVRLVAVVHVAGIVVGRVASDGGAGIGRVGRLSPWGVVLAENLGRPRAAIIEGGGRKRRDTA